MSHLPSLLKELHAFSRLHHPLTVHHICKAFRWGEEVSGRILKDQTKENGTQKKGWETIWVKILKILLDNKLLLQRRKILSDIWHTLICG